MYRGRGFLCALQNRLICALRVAAHLCTRGGGSGGGSGGSGVTKAGGVGVLGVGVAGVGVVGGV